MGSSHIHDVHPLIVHMRREPDEFDFHATSREQGMKAALTARDEQYGGTYWGW